MPELPEVETVKNVLNNIAKGKTISYVEVVRPQTVRSDLEQFQDVLKGATILDFTRYGKYIIYHLDRDYVLVSHLRMEGKYYHRDEKIKPNHNDLVLFHFTDGSYLAFNDTRRFGTMELVLKDGYLEREPLNEIGPDPFMMKDSSRLYEAFKNKGVAIKPCLLDQSVMSGLGNIYVDEVLFACKIHPETPAKLLSKKQYDEIWKWSKDIMGRAIQKGGTTVISYHPTEGIDGEFVTELKVYGQNGGKCVNCGTPLVKKFVGGRGTTFCPHCQRNIARPFVLGLTGPIGSGKSEVGKYLESKGFVYLSSDAIVHHLYELKSVQEGLRRFVPHLKVKDGKVDRVSLRDEIIANPRVKRYVERYIHELVIEELERQIKKCTKDQHVVAEVPLLFQSGYDLYCDKTLMLEVSEKSQLSHLENRKEDIEKALRLNARFADLNNKKATYTIDNNGSVADLYQKLDTIFCKMYQ
ncbi:MAG: DNA-formamidopyrimidine glycosylase [Bacilli bacterium]|nr:DNA-formamidopyrimidine glycosylase [Bacilli bacterium]MBR0194254.1 DNA-formamidopyrimidine glycosylase [Bacilli bacterium]